MVARHNAILAKKIEENKEMMKTLFVRIIEYKDNAFLPKFVYTQCKNDFIPENKTIMSLYFT